MTQHEPSELKPAEVIMHIAKVARDVGMQAGVGGMETAGSFVSFLAANPHYIDEFFKGGSAIDWPAPWHSAGCLSWHGQDGKLHWPGEGEMKQ